jgi:hypothetical protein
MIAKPRPRMLEKADKRAAVAIISKAENAKVKQRSGGQCEVIEVGTTLKRCPLRASHVHHLIGGSGKRNVGKSITAACKLHVCERCHELIHGHVLKPINGYEREAAATVRYERVL